MQDRIFGIGAHRQAEWSIGLDFGTAFSKAAATRIMPTEEATLREVRPLRIGEIAGCNRPYLVPSALFLDRQRVHFGPYAVKKLIDANIEERELVRSFKRVLGANDFEDALNRYHRPAVDPDRMFRLGELIVLYLAYLLALVEESAVVAFGARNMPACRVRFTRPGWIPERIAAAHEVMTLLFNRAHLVHRALGNALIAPEGVEYGAARAALDAASEANAKFPSLDGGIYEASAVGLCHYSDHKTPNYLLIVDIGAGTTDVAALVRAPFNREICIVRAGRRTIDIAGDHFDGALIDLLIAKTKLKTEADRTALANRVTPIIRELKEELFSNGLMQASFRGRRIACTVQELERQPAFRKALGEITRLYEGCLSELVVAARREGVRTIGVVLAGGGSHIPAIQRMVAKQRWTGLGVQLKHLPAVPAWVHTLGHEHDYVPLFSQMSAAFGAAISMPEQPDQPETTESTRVLTI